MQQSGKLFLYAAVSVVKFDGGIERRDVFLGRFVAFFLGLQIRFFFDVDICLFQFVEIETDELEFPFAVGVFVSSSYSFKAALYAL